MQMTSYMCPNLLMVYCIQRKPYITIPGALLSHILQESNLTHIERLYYLLADLYAHLNVTLTGPREAEKSGFQWSKLLNCSEEHVFKMQKKLEAAGYFHIIREIDEDNQNEKNIIIPTVPNNIFNNLIKESNRQGSEHLVFIATDSPDYKRKYLDASKMFIKFNIQLIKLLLSENKLTSLQKLIWLHAFCRSYVAYIDLEGEGTRNFITTYKELAILFNCSEKTISTAINSLFNHGYLSKKQFYIKDKKSLGRRKKKSCWELAALFPREKMEVLLKQPDRQNLASLTQDDLRLYGLDPRNNSTETSKPSNSLVGLGGSFDELEYNNKNNILNIKNNVTDLSQKINDHNSSSQESNNVFFEKELLVSDDELAKGLNIAARFEAETFLKPQKNLANLEEVIKQVDGTFTTGEHWLVTKTAFTLHHKLQTEVLSKYGLKYDDDVVTKLKEQLFTPVEERLISLWESFSDVPDKSQQDEFLIRKSWLLRLIPNYSVRLKNNQMTQHAPIVKDPSLDLTIPDLPGDKADKAKKFAKKLLTNKLAKGYSSSLSIDDLAKELIYHAANWIPARLNCKSREEQIDAALSVAWKAVEKGIWQCPYRLLNMQIRQRELESVSWKSL